MASVTTRREMAPPYEHAVRQGDVTAALGFNTAEQAEEWARRESLEPGSYLVERRPVGFWGQESTRLDQFKLYTVPEISVILGNLSQYTIRRLAKQGAIEWVKGDRNSVLMTEGQIAALLRHLSQPIRPPEVYRPLPNGIDSLTSPRSQAIARNKAFGRGPRPLG